MPDIAKLEELVKTINFPIAKDRIIKTAKVKGISDYIISKIEKIKQEYFKSEKDFKKNFGNL